MRTQVSVPPPDGHAAVSGIAAGALTTTSRWSTLYRIAGVAALTIAGLIPLQILIFVLWPPPATVLDYFSVFSSNTLLGLLDLDLLLVVDQVLTILVLLGLYIALRHTDESLALVGVTLGIVGAVLFIISREATIDMLTLSQQYASANADADRAPLLAAGQTVLTVYNGTAFSLGYFLSGLAILLLSTVMFRSQVFSRATGIAGVLAGATGLLPANFGLPGLVMSLMSLVPLVVWLVLVGRRLLQLQQERLIQHQE